MTPEFSYRPEIDGLRALAVVPVVLFHAGFDYFSGGYVGVDVFFVISGYLITSIIITEIHEGTFTLANFYARRARRILPALFLVVWTSLWLSYWFLTPAELQNFGQSVTAVSIFTSNIFFWRDSGYFSGASELKPLLHTWSLAVEEQFYIFFPIFLLIFWRFGLKVLMTLLAVVFFISFSLAVWASSAQPHAGFYLLPTRGWELLIGSFIAIFVFRSGFVQNRAINEAMSFLGVALIVISIILFDTQTPFPGTYALMPTIGAGLVIFSGGSKSLISQLLSTKIAVGIGLVSYSAYLWHQPALAIFRSHTNEIHINSGAAFFLCALSFLLAFVSWRYVEGPFRDKRMFNDERILRLAACTTVLTLLAGLTLNQTNGLEAFKLSTKSEEERKSFALVKESTSTRLKDRMYDLGCHIWATDSSLLSMEELNECEKQYGSPILVLGDSHGMNLYNMVSNSNRFQFVIGLAQGGCRPYGLNKNCHYQSFLEFIPKISHWSPIVIYHQSGGYLIKNKLGDFEPDYDDYFSFASEEYAFLASYLNEIQRRGADVVWLGPFTEYNLDPAETPFRIAPLPEGSFRVSRYIEENVKTANAKSLSVAYVPFDSFFTITSDAVVDDCLLWSDPDHFSECGEQLLSKKANWDALGLRDAP